MHRRLNKCLWSCAKAFLAAQLSFGQDKASEQFFRMLNRPGITQLNTELTRTAVVEVPRQVEVTLRL